MLVKTKTQNKILWGAVMFLGIGALCTVAFAASGSFQNNTENGDINVYNSAAQTDKAMGAVSSENTHLSAYPPTAFDNTFVDGDLEVDGVAYFDGGIDLASGYAFDLNELDTYVSYGSMADATTTLFCVASPFSSTSTVDFAGIYMTGYATTTHSIIVSTSTISTGRTTSTVAVGTHNLITATNVTGTTWGVLFSGVASAIQGTPATSYGVNKIVVAANEYVCGVVGEGDGGYTTGVTNAANTFAGTYKLRWTR